MTHSTSQPSVTSTPVGEEPITQIPSSLPWMLDPNREDRTSVDPQETIAPLPFDSALPEPAPGTLGYQKKHLGTGLDLDVPVDDGPPLQRPRLSDVLAKTLTWGRWQDWSLRFKATGVILVLVLRSLSSLGMAATFFAGRSLETKIKQLSQDTTQATADKVAFFLKQRYGDIQVLANADFLRNPQLLSGKLRTPDQESDKLDQFLKAYGVYDSIAVTIGQEPFASKVKAKGLP